jgi:hypothetical protein
MPRFTMQLASLKSLIRDPFERLRKLGIDPDQDSCDIGRQCVDPGSRPAQIDEPLAIGKKIESQRIRSALDR